MKNIEISQFDVELATTPAPAQAASLENRLMIELRDAGVHDSELPKVFATLEPLLDEWGDQRAANTLLIIFERLPKGRAGTEMRGLLATASGIEVTEDAHRLKISPQSLHRSILRLRKRIFRQNG